MARFGKNQLEMLDDRDASPRPSGHRNRLTVRKENSPMNQRTFEVENVTPIESKQPQAQCRFTINATLRGFPITIEG